MIKVYSRFICLILFIFMAVPAYSQNSYQRDYIKNSFKLSLMSLRQKAQEIVQRNNWLWAQIESLKREIPYLQNQIEDYVMHSEMQSLQLEPRTSKSQTPKKVEILTLDEKIFISGEGGNNPDMEESSKLQEGLLKEVSGLNLEIQQIEKKIAEVEKGGVIPFDPSYSKEKQMLLEQIREVRKKISDSKNYLAQLQKRHGRRSEVYRSLLEKQNLLKQKFVLLENELNLGKQEHANLQEELSQLENKQKMTFEELNQNVVELRSDGEVLEKALKRAHNKIENKQIDFDITDDELRQLMENVLVIERERERLQKEYATLTKDYNQLKKGDLPFLE